MWFSFLFCLKRQETAEHRKCILPSLWCRAEIHVPDGRMGQREGRAPSVERERMGDNGLPLFSGRRFGAADFFFGARYEVCI
jgi:hypothetical protein